MNWSHGVLFSRIMFYGINYCDLRRKINKKHNDIDVLCGMDNNSCK